MQKGTMNKVFSKFIYRIIYSSQKAFFNCAEKPKMNIVSMSVFVISQI